jgi:hypothetical protein
MDAHNPQEMHPYLSMVALSGVQNSWDPVDVAQLELITISLAT